jgi:acyl carrier protein
MAVTGADLVEVLRLAGIGEAVVAAVRPDAPLLLQGLDSVDFPAFVAALEERFHLDIPEKEALTLRTLNDFAALVERLSGKP